ncbi:MAG: hypothetical protein KJ915_07340 [Candidatus Omnitrophica bacterium]|nr:hypothetical protein [Candidatus Omnitrophota bacterium]
MILPSKHVSISESLFGLGGILLKFLDKPKTLDELWWDYAKVNNTKQFPAHHGFDNIVFALDYLFCIGAVNIDGQGKIYNDIT